MFVNPTIQDFINRELGGATPISRPPPQAVGSNTALARALLGNVTLPRQFGSFAAPSIRPGPGPTAPLPSEGVGRYSGSQVLGQAQANLGGRDTGASGLTTGIGKIGTGIESGLAQYAANRAQQQAYAGTLATMAPALRPLGGAPAAAPFGTPSAGANLPYFSRGPGPSVSGDYFAKVQAIENPSGNPYATSSTGATGNWQFIPSTWRQFGAGGNIHDPAAQDAAMQRFTQSNYNTLQSALGRAPTDAELYLAHQQGAAGALKLLQNPNTPAGQLVGSQAISVNGGNPNAPASSFVNKWGSRFGDSQSYSDQLQDQQQDAQQSAAPSSPANAASPSQPVIPGQQNPHLPGFDPHSVPFTNTPVGAQQQGMLQPQLPQAPGSNPLAAALAGNSSPLLGGDQNAEPSLAPGIVSLLNALPALSFGGSLG